MPKRNATINEMLGVIGIKCFSNEFAEFVRDMIGLSVKYDIATSRLRDRLIEQPNNG